MSDLKPVDGKLSVTLDPDTLYTLTTTTGQGRGTAQPPAARPFPIPYAEDFSQTPVGRSPKYLADQDGAFEVRDCKGRSGRCLEQVITEKPVAWGPIPNPFTMAGDDGWKDYRVAADVFFLSASPAVLMGRIDSGDVFRDGRTPYPSGYLLRVTPGGNWQLLSTQYKQETATLDSGHLTFDRSQWHRLELSFHGKKVVASLDGKPLTRISSSAHTHGMIALGTEWDHVQFGKLMVGP